MKTKFLTVLAMLACTMFVSAQSFNRIYVNISQGTASDQVRLFEAPSFTAAYDNNYDVVKMSLNSDIYIYAMAPNAQNIEVAHSKVYTNDLQGLVLGYQAAADGLATITFSDLRSDLNDVTEYYLLDQENGQLTVIGDPYQFNAVAGNDPDRFMIVKPVKVTTNASGLATFSHASALAPVETGVKLYKGAVNGEYLDLTQVDDIAAAQGVIVYGEANTTYHFNVINGATADFTGNELIAASAWNATHTGYDIYVLSGNALYLYEGTEFPEHKAFLKIAQSGSGAPRRISLRFDQATAIDNVAAENVKAEKVVENGQIFIRRGNEVYNLQGQLVK